MRTGALPPGEGLPPVRGLARQLGVSPATVAKAYRELRQRGLVETAGRNGTRVRPRSVATRAAARPAAGAGLRDLSAGEPDRRLLPPLAAHLRAVAGAFAAPLTYADAGVLPELADAARERFAADGVPAGDVTVTNGALDAVERLLTAHLCPGDAVAVEDPGWGNLFDLVAALGLTPVPLAVDDEGPLPGALAAALSAGVGAVLVTSRAQNPTGAAVTADRAAALRRALRERPGTLLVEDDHAAELAAVAPHPLAGATDRWAFVRSASKPFGPDLRIAVVAGDEATVARVAGRMRIGTGWVSTVTQRLLLRLWSDPGVTAAVAAARAGYDARRDALAAALAARGCAAHATTGINVWVPVPDETRTVAALRDEGWAVAPGSLFRLASAPGVRLTVSPLDPADVEPLADAVARAVRPPTGRFTR
ncbi:GntR family transcriptional regulator [Spirilliplanes yamanashiensis]|uniref:GntR family transcriptional regulator n=1 Tax=Spirilliplanes yamanashiensis TaxID=42233 RepID=A0A8J4DI21_9ACTN|nr:GntR family transcriptional regulator [Spirilliplanes yamanashiensis]